MRKLDKVTIRNMHRAIREKSPKLAAKELGVSVSSLDRYLRDMTYPNPLKTKETLTISFMRNLSVAEAAKDWGHDYDKPKVTLAEMVIPPKIPHWNPTNSYNSACQYHALLSMQKFSLNHSYTTDSSQIETIYEETSPKENNTSDISAPNSPWDNFERVSHYSPLFFDNELPSVKKTRKYDQLLESVAEDSLIVTLKVARTTF